MKRCPTCGAEMTRALDHNCGTVTISKDEYRTLQETFQAALQGKTGDPS